MALLKTVTIFFSFLVAGSLAASISINHETRLGTTLSVKEPIDPSKKYHLGWTVNKEKQEITFEIEAQAKGYVGFGLSPNGAMTGADLFIAGVDDKGAKYSGDYHGTKNGMPTKDDHDDWVLIDAKENDTHTILKFSRALETCDEKDFPINGDTSRVIWSLGTNDDLEYHADRGTASVQFLTPEQPFNPSDFSNFTTTIEMVMPKQDTSYWCSLHKGPTFDKKQHVVGFEPYLPSEAAEEHTHHFVLYGCSAPEGEDPEQFFGQWLEDGGGHCYGDEKDVPFFKYCGHEAIFVWAKGGKRMVLPDDVGYPIGENVGVPQFYMMEIHYDNPQEKEGLKFNTGLRTFYTPDLRKIEAAVMVVGHEVNPSTVVPPKTENFMVVGHCAPECTKAYFPGGGITIFNSLLHAHLSGRKLKVRHFRDGEELPWIDNDGHYDFNFQQNKPLAEFRKVLPGDQITYECTYDSTWNEKNEAIVGGFSSRNEMCEGFFWYYPKVDMVGCSSSYPLEKGLNELGITEYHDVINGGLPTIYIDKPENMTGPYMEGISFNFTWTEEYIQEFQEKRWHGEHDITCPRVNGTVKYPALRQEYVPEEKCESAAGIFTSTAVLPLMSLVLLCSQIL